MVAFYNEQDQEIYDNVSKFMPQSKYLRSAPTFTAPTTEEEEITETFGIPNTNAFTNSGGDNYTGGYNFNNNGFQQAVDARQYNLNNPNKIGQFVNKGLDFIGIQPQRSYQDMIESRLTDERKTSGIPLGVGSMIAKALPDRYYDMSLADQAFIQSQMGYTGPTIFGENNSGLGKDEFGINTRSAFGNYAEYVDKKGKSDMTDEEFADYVAGLKGLPKRMALTYRKKSILRNKIQQDTLNQQMAKDQEYGAKGMSDPNDRSRAGSLGRRPGSGGTVDRVTEGPGQNVSNVDNQAYDSGGREGFGYGLKEGGRAGYFFGGRVNYKVGGRTDAESQYGADSVGSYDSSANQSDRGQSYGINNNPPVSTGDNNKIVTTDFITENPSLTVDYTDPRNYASIYGKIGFDNILDNDDLTAAGNVTGEFGPIGYNTNFTDKGITGTNLTAGNFNANISPDMQVQNIGYNNNINGINYGVNTDFDNTMFTAGVKFKNGGLASIL